MENTQNKDRIPRDSALASFVTASADEIRYARELREPIEQRYLNRPTPAPAAWTVGVD
jgi:hypothetical protein